MLTNETAHIVYGGTSLKTAQTVFWKVRAWDKAGQPSAWSKPATWTMGLLQPTDWQAQWIADPASVTNHTMRGPLNGYHSQIAGSSNTTKWVAIDLGKPQLIDGVRLFPARPYDWQPDTPGFLFPARFRIEVAEQSSLADARVVVDRTTAEEPGPGTNAPVYRFESTSARYVRLTVTQLRRRDSDQPCGGPGGNAGVGR